MTKGAIHAANRSHQALEAEGKDLTAGATSGAPQSGTSTEERG
jgi:hypothetical protein